MLTIEGDYADFAHLETVYLGCMARRTLIMRNVREVVDAARGKPILYFPARHDHWLVQTGDGWAAHIAGAIGVSTDAQASWWGGRGVGTVPHGLIAAYGGDTALAARKFADRFGRDMNVTVLVDFVNDSVRTALEVAEALGDDLWGVRLDTSDKLADESLRRLHGEDAPTGVAAELVELTRSELDKRGLQGRPHRRLRRLQRPAHLRVRGRRRAGGLLRRRLLADPRRQRLHRRRRDERRQAVREGRARVPPEPAARARPLARTSGTKRTRSRPLRSSPRAVRCTTNSRWSPVSTGTTSRAPTPSCSSSACGMWSPAAAATLIASNGAVSGRPRPPSPTTSVTLKIFAASRLRCACSESAGWRSTLQTCAPRRPSSAAW